MLPLKNSGLICLNESSLVALMSTAVFITAAATFWCTRRFRSIRVIEKIKDTAIKPIETSEKVSESKNFKLTNEPAAIDDLSYLCTSCGIEKYSNEQFRSIPKSSGPYKMVVLVRTDISMV